MTQQSSETLRYRGREYTLLGLPLDTCTDPEVKERLVSEAEKLKARMDATRGGGA